MLNIFFEKVVKKVIEGDEVIELLSYWVIEICVLNTAHCNQFILFPGIIQSIPHWWFWGEESKPIYYQRQFLEHR